MYGVRAHLGSSTHHIESKVRRCSTFRIFKFHELDWPVSLVARGRATLGEIMMLVSWATVISRLVRHHSGSNSLRAKRLLRSVLVKTLQLLSA